MVMASIQELGNERLTEIAREMLDVRFGSVCAWSDKMSENEYRFALRTIAQGRYLEDALAHIPDKMWGPLQASSSWATIPQAFGPTIALEVRISPLAGSYVCGAYLYTYDMHGEPVCQADICHLVKK